MVSKEKGEVTLGPEITQLSPEDERLSNAWQAAVANAPEVEGDTKEPFNSDKAPVVELGKEYSAAPEEQPEWKEGEVFSIKTRRPVNPDAPRGIVSQQKRDFEALKEKLPDSNEETSDVVGFEKQLESDLKAAFEKEPLSNEEHEKAKIEWKRTRDYYNGEIKDGRPTGIEAEFNEKYASFLESESKGWRRVANLPRRLFGLRPKLSPELQRLEAASYVAREKYFEATKILSDQEKRPKKGALTDEQRVKAFERYQGMLARKLVVGVSDERKAIQEKIALESGEHSPLKRFKPTLEKLKEHKYKLLGLRVLGYAALGGAAAASGGLVAAAGAGAFIAYRLGAGAAAGAAVGAGLRGASDSKIKWLHGRLEETKTDVQGNLFKRGFADAEANVEKLTRQIEETEASAKIASVGGAVIAGVTAGNLSGNLIEALGPGDVADQTQPENADVTPPATETPASPREMGDASVAEAMQPQVEAAIHEMESGARPQPQFNDPQPIETGPRPHVFNHAQTPDEAPIPAPRPEVSPTLPDQAPIPTPRPEIIPGLPDINHTVVKGDNVWNIMEGKGPDANPVGGKSEVLQGMSLADRQAALDELVRYYEAHPEDAMEAGVLKSNGDIHKIYPGEELNISMFDAKLRELLGIEGGLPENVPTPEPRPDVVAPVDTVVSPEASPSATEAVVADINDLTVQEVFDLGTGFIANDPQALARLEVLGMDPYMIGDIMDKLAPRYGTLDTEMTLREFLSTPETPPTEISPTDNSYSRTPDGAPYGEYDPFQDNSARVSEASFTPANDNAGVEAAPSAEQSVQAVADYVKSVEKGTGGFLEGLFGLGQPSVEGTFSSSPIQNMTIGEMMSIDANNNIPEGVNQEGWDRWVGTIKDAMERIPANDNVPVDQYVAQVANTRVA